MPNIEPGMNSCEYSVLQFLSIKFESGVHRATCEIKMRVYYTRRTSGVLEVQQEAYQ